MSDWQEIFECNDSLDGPGRDFEERVFAKIKKKKRQRKVGMAITAIAGTAVLLSLFQLFRPAPPRNLPAGVAPAKEEVPLSEDFFFSASDSRTRYSLEPVSYPKKAAVPEAGLNQI